MKCCAAERSICVRTVMYLLFALSHLQQLEWSTQQLRVPITLLASRPARLSRFHRSLSSSPLHCLRKKEAGFDVIGY